MTAADHTPSPATDGVAEAVAQPTHDDDCESRGCTHCEVCGVGVLYGSRCSAHPMLGSSGAVAHPAPPSETATEAVVEYVVGFAIDGTQRVALIRKNRPEWQAGRLNGIGGHVEPGETAWAAMCREWCEETGQPTPANWQEFVVMDFPGARIHFYRALGLAPGWLDGCRSTTDEEVVVHPLASLAMAPAHLLPNLSWLLPLAAYTGDDYEPIHVRATTAEAVPSPAPPVSSDEDRADEGTPPGCCPSCGAEVRCGECGQEFN